MKRWILSTVVLGFATAAWAQSSGGTGGDRPNGGTPGSWVQAAIARHKALIGVRVNAPRGGHAGGDRSSLVPSAAPNTPVTVNTGSNTLDSLLSLIGAGGSGSTLGALSGLLGNGFTGTGSTGTGFTGTGTTTSGGGSATDPRLAALLALRDANSGSTAQKVSTATRQAISAPGVSGGDSAPRVGGAAVNRLPKVEERLQSSGGGNAAETPFAVRWANAMLTTFFTAVTSGFQSSGFITFLKDTLRPLMYPPEASENGGSSGNDGSSGGGGSSGSGSGGGGGGIEDLPPSGGGSGSGGSTL